MTAITCLALECISDLFLASVMLNKKNFSHLDVYSPVCEKFFLFGFLQDFSLSLIFSTLIFIFLAVIFFVFLTWGSLHFSYLYKWLLFFQKLFFSVLVPFPSAWDYCDMNASPFSFVLQVLEVLWIVRLVNI